MSVGRRKNTESSLPGFVLVATSQSSTCRLRACSSKVVILCDLVRQSTFSYNAKGIRLKSYEGALFDAPSRASFRTRSVTAPQFRLIDTSSGVAIHRQLAGLHFPTQKSIPTRQLGQSLPIGFSIRFERVLYDHSFNEG